MNNDLLIHRDGVYAYRPMDVRGITGVAKDVLIYWCRKGLIDHRMTPTGHRRYCNRSIRQVAAIMEMRAAQKEENKPASE